jgi:hypothetical protein
LTAVLQARDISADSRSELWEGYQAIFQEIEMWEGYFQPAVIADYDTTSLSQVPEDEFEA